MSKIVVSNSLTRCEIAVASTLMETVEVAVDFKTLSESNQHYTINTDDRAVRGHRNHLYNSNALINKHIYHATLRMHNLSILSILLPYIWV